jgi:hypothetical protein
MAATEYGVALIYGVLGVRTDMVVQSDSHTTRFALDVEVMDEQGRVITDRLDDKRDEITLEGVVKTSGSPVVGDEMTYGGVTYILKEVTDRGSNQEYRKVSVRGVKYEQIS